MDSSEDSDCGLTIWQDPHSFPLIHLSNYSFLLGKKQKESL